MVSSSGVSTRIAVDAMGSDLGPSEIVEAVKLALAEFPDLNPITLVGDQMILRPLLSSLGLTNHPKLAVFQASEVITMDDKPLVALKRKKDSSMVRAIELVKSGEAGAAVSCGNTGSLVAAGILKLRTLEGVDRAALAAVVPRKNGHFILLDAGANPEAKSEHLVHNAILGTHYCRMELGVDRPRVGLLTIGTEEGKGNQLINQTHEALKQLGGIVNYVGPIEGFQIFLNTVDVVVCDGFTGNICLKSWESLVRFVSRELKGLIRANPMRMAGALLAKGALDGLKHRILPERYGGAPLLGLGGCVIKAHGSANRHSLMNAIHDASELVRVDFNQLIEADVRQANALFPSSPL